MFDIPNESNRLQLGYFREGPTESFTRSRAPWRRINHLTNVSTEGNTDYKSDQQETSMVAVRFGLLDYVFMYLRSQMKEIGQTS